jgi:hypothetical protein
MTSVLDCPFQLAGAVSERLTFSSSLHSRALCSDILEAAHENLLFFT